MEQLLRIIVADSTYVSTMKTRGCSELFAGYFCKLIQERKMKDLLVLRMRELTMTERVLW